MFAAKDTLFTRPSGSYQISRSVRLRSSASAYLNRTFGTPTSGTTWTWSGWVKLGTIGSGTLFEAGTGASNTFMRCTFGQVSQELNWRQVTPVGGLPAEKGTTQLFRDPSAWYHIVCVWDTNNGTAADRQRVYVNGVQVTAFSASTNPSSGLVSYFNTSGYVHYLGVVNIGGLGGYLDGYLTEINFVDGQALTPSSFGSTNAITGVWQPKKYGGTYGANGFYLNFSDNSNNTATTIGKDYSGNGNNWTPNNISVTAGVTYDSMIDVPTPYADGGNGRGNYAVMNPNDQAGGLVLADGNLKVTAATGWDGARATFSYPSTGKWYWEGTCISRSTGANVGILSTAAVITGDLGAAATGYAYNSGDGNKYNNGVNVAYGATWGANDILGIAWDADTGTLSFYKNGASQGTAYTGLTGAFSPMLGVNGSDSMVANFGQRPFSYTPPTGFVALNTQNLPAPTISNGAGYMAATTYTGTGSALTIANTVGSASFQPDWVWVKSRSAATDHAIYDSVRGVQKQIESNSSGAETTETTGLTAFGSTGFTVGALAQMNTSSATYVAWQWKASNATAVTNTSGSITSTVSANTTAGFSIVQFTATGATATVGHGLGVAPQMIIVKDAASAGNWAVWNTGLTSTAYFLFMNTTAAQSNASAIWTGTPSSTTFGIGSWHTADRQIAYCFAPVAGYSAFGKYTGNGSTDGPFVFLGFRPRWVLVKISSGSTGSWYLWDSSRDTYNVASNTLFPDLSNAEGTGVNFVDFLSNGFKLRNAGGSTNGSGFTFIYACFAENPFKNSLAR